MLLGIVFALLSAAVTTLLLRTLSAAAVVTPRDPSLSVYRDQLTELETDLARGLIEPDQAAAARAEIARRVLRQAGPSNQARGTDKSSAWARIWELGAELSPAFRWLMRAGHLLGKVSPSRAHMLSVLAVPLLGVAVYLKIGSPSLPGQPLAGRLAAAPEAATPADLIAKVEARLREKPDDGQGWAVIAPVYLAQGRAIEAGEAFAKAMQLVGETPERLAGFARANVIAGNGVVNEPAHKAYQRMLALDPTRADARYWLAVFEEQNGRPEIAADAYRQLLAEAKPEAPWRKAVEERLKAVSVGKSGPPVLASPASSIEDRRGNPSPSEFVAAAQKLAPEMRELMIGSRMIPKARDAVKQNPKDWAAWSRIVTGFAAIGKSGEALSALKEARSAAGGDAAGLAQLETLAKDLGLNS